MVLHVTLSRLSRVMRGMLMVAVSSVGMMCRLLMIACFMVLTGFTMMMSGLLVVFSGLGVVASSFLGHSYPPEPNLNSVMFSMAGRTATASLVLEYEQRATG